MDAFGFGSGSLGLYGTSINVVFIVFSLNSNYAIIFSTLQAFKDDLQISHINIKHADSLMISRGVDICFDQTIKPTFSFI